MCKQQLLRIKQQHLWKWAEVEQKLLNSGKVRCFGIMHKYGSYILNFHCLLYNYLYIHIN